jgi:hypothetical protein
MIITGFTRMHHLARPKKEDYEGFIKLMKKELSNYPDICFFTYGSSISNGRIDIGRSDIDGVIIVNCGLVIPLETIRSLSKIIFKCLKSHEVEAHINLTTRECNRDGRFMSYTQDFIECFEKFAVIHSGPDYLCEMRGLQYKAGPLNAAAIDLRDVRNGLLFADYNLYKNSDIFNKSFINAMECFAKMPKKLLWLRGREIISSRFEAADTLKNILPELDYSFLNKINNLLSNPPAIDLLLKNSKQVLLVYEEILINLEKMIEAYIKKFPNISSRESRSNFISYPLERNHHLRKYSIENKERIEPSLG